MYIEFEDLQGLHPLSKDGWYGDRDKEAARLWEFQIGMTHHQSQESGEKWERETIKC